MSLTLITMMMVIVTFGELNMIPGSTFFRFFSLPDDCENFQKGVPSYINILRRFLGYLSAAICT